MNLERLLTETLHQADAYEPSPDLFARVELSLEEDGAHRRRVRVGVTGAIGGFIVAAAFLVATSSPGPLGSTAAPAWALESLTLAVQIAVMLIVGPSIRRFGQIYAADAFRLNPSTGIRFLDLFDVAFYLLFTGWIVMGVQLGHLDRMRPLGAYASDYIDRIATFLLVMGASHALTLLALPVIGLVFGSSVRRARRLEAGAAAPPVAAGAAMAERVVKFFVWVLALLAVGGGIMVFALIATRGLIDP